MSNTTLEVCAIVATTSITCGFFTYFYKSMQDLDIQRQKQRNEEMMSDVVKYMVEVFGTIYSQPEPEPEVEQTEQTEQPDDLQDLPEYTPLPDDVHVKDE